MQSLNVVEVPVRVCKNCRWWMFRDERQRGVCAEIGYQNDAREEPDQDAYLTTTCGEEDGELVTRPDFGCVLFEAKEEA